jgi:hypothetical protein
MQPFAPNRECAVATDRSIAVHRSFILSLGAVHLLDLASVLAGL